MTHVASKSSLWTSSLSEDQWLNSLAQCESGNFDFAINPKDTDGTQSLGRYQFKVGTFLWLLEKYTIPQTSIFNGTTQREIVKHMIHDPDIQMENQFPDCIRHHIGLPPRGG